MNDQFNKGDIILGVERGAKDKAYHPIIYFKEIDALFFLGGMITHSKKFGNIPLSDTHFEKKISSEPQFFVKNYLIKKMEWSPFKAIGQLTQEGISFVESHLEGTEPQIWEDYNKP
ncbi:MAG: hypothetical protein WAU36_18920 [Cyclobacteriaceae bacterium]